MQNIAMVVQEMRGQLDEVRYKINGLQNELIKVTAPCCHFKLDNAYGQLPLASS